MPLNSPVPAHRMYADIICSMPGFVERFFIWLSSIVMLWATLSTGGVVIAILWLVGSKFKKFQSWPATGTVAGIFFAFAVFQSWELQYTSNFGRDALLSRCSTAKASSEMQVGTLQSDKSRAQSNLATCLTNTGAISNLATKANTQAIGSTAQLTTSLVPEPERIRVLLWQSIPNPQWQTFRGVAITNKTISGPHFLFSCNNPVLGVAVSSPNASMDIMGGTDYIHRSENVIEVTRRMLTWSPMEPLTLFVRSPSSDLQCQITR
jgi:hypothetical protein